MNGQEVYRFAVSACVRDLRAVCEKADVPLEEVDWFLLHQANQRILNAAQTRLKQPKEKFPGNIERLGNTSLGLHPAAAGRNAPRRQAPGGAARRAVRLWRGAHPWRGAAAHLMSAPHGGVHIKKPIHTSFARRNFP